MVFEPTRLTLARQRRGFTKAGLARVVGLTPKSITAHEAGDTIPSAETVFEFSRALNFPNAFFEAAPVKFLVPESASFRAFSSMTASDRDVVLSAGTLAIALSEWIEKRFNLPEISLPDIREHSPEAASEELRGIWKLGNRPIKNMVHLLESKGIKVFSLAEESRKIDAFSLRQNGVPFVFLNTMKGGERGRFDAAHELGHLVLHRHGSPQGREAEAEADSFAAAFLMPKDSVLAANPRFPTLRTLKVLKKTWDVSLAALVRRLRDLNLLTEWTYRTFCIEMGELGYRSAEPDGIARENSQVFEKVFKSLRDDGISKQDVAKELLIPPKELENLVFGLVLSPLVGGGTGSSNPPAGRIHGLRVVGS
jgi:Zn-dependent peptidase ImmA (M78 family)/DNA-binding XRE family transcriptional regulator